MSTLLLSDLQMNPQIKKPDGTVKPMTEKQRQLAVQAWNANLDSKAKTEEMKELKGQIEKSFGTGTSYEVPGITKGSVAETTSMSISSPDELKEVLGKDFKLLTKEVKSEVSYKPTDALKALALDADDPRSSQVRECLTINQGVTVTLRGSTSKAG